MVDIARYAFRLSAWNELAGVDDIFVLIYYVKNNGTAEIEISSTYWYPLGSKFSFMNELELPTKFTVVLVVLTSPTLYSIVSIPSIDPKLKRRTLARIGYPGLKLDDIRPGK